MTEIDYILEIQNGLPRQGPGDNESTLLALNCIKSPPDPLSMLDIGCGPGMQTIALAKNIRGTVVAIDFYEIFLEQLKTAVLKEKLENKISLIHKSMFEMDFSEKSFDIIWSEGSVYIYGFEKALNDLKVLLKNNGHMVCSHISWLQENPPSEIIEYWKEMYEEIKTININLATAVNCGYEVVYHFILPEESWWENYYSPLLERLDYFRDKYKDDPEGTQIINSIQVEIAMFRKYSEFYGYVFYILKKQ